MSIELHLCDGAPPNSLSRLGVFEDREKADAWAARHAPSGKSRIGRPPTPVRVTFTDGKSLVFASMSDFAATDHHLTVARVSEALRRAKPRHVFGFSYPVATLRGNLIARESDYQAYLASKEVQP